jgi:hypothetical protein
MPDGKDDNKPNYDGYEHLVALALSGLKAEKAAEWAQAHMNVSKIKIDAQLTKGRADAFYMVANGLKKAFDCEAKHRIEMAKHEARVAQMQEHPAFRDMPRRNHATPN